MSSGEHPFSGPGASSGDAPLASTGANAQDEARTAKIANRFDIRRLIGGLFLIYGTILLVLGLVGSHAVKTKAAGINIDLWTGIGMLVFGALMLFWALSKPVMPEPDETRSEGSSPIRRAPAT